MTHKKPPATQGVAGTYYDTAEAARMSELVEQAGFELLDAATEGNAEAMKEQVHAVLARLHAVID